MFKIFIATSLSISYMFAEIVVPSGGSDLKITIYNSNKAFVNDKRTVNIETGKQKLVYVGVPSSLITQSVVPTFEGVETTLFSQNYIYDLVSLNAMLNKSIDREVSFYTNGREPKLLKGIVMSASPQVMIKESGSGSIYTLNAPTQVIFSSVPKNMITKPSLIWNVETKKSGKLDIDLKYLTKGISWKSDYVLNLDKKTLDLHAWITVNNNSGVSYENAQISCVAGELNSVQEPRMEYRRMKGMAMADAAVQEESFSGYHLYKIPFRETIANKQQKQIAFIDQKGVKYRQYGKNVNSYFEKYGEQKLSFANVITFDNDKNNSMGLPLPSGVVRMYQKDSNGETHYIGEDRVKNIPENERVTLKIGQLFDAVGEKKISKYVARSGYRNVETTYSVRNQGKEPLSLKIEERIPVYGDKITQKNSCKGICSVEKKNAFVREFTIRLKAKEAYQFTSEFEAIF